MTHRKTYYAIMHLPSKMLFFGCDEDHPVKTRYGLYHLSVAEQRRANMHHPEDWEVVVSPIQDEKQFN